MSFESILSILGRFHVVVLHLPIGLAAGLVAMEFASLLRRSPPARHVRTTLALLLGLSAAASAGTGLLLANSSAMEDSLLEQHRNWGLAAAGFCFAAAVLGAAANSRPRTAAYLAALFFGAAAMVPAGHLGGRITHGPDFLLAPAQPPRDERPAAPEETGAGQRDVLYESVVQPFLVRYCIECHGGAKPKGRLDLSTLDGLLAGGRRGPAAVPGDPEGSELLRRMRLPEEDEHRMPPPRKPQPTELEAAAVAAWIANPVR